MSAAAPIALRGGLLRVAARELGGLLRTPTGWLLAALVLALDALQLNGVAMGTERRPSAEVLELFLLNAAFVTEGLGALLAMRLRVDEREGDGALLLSAPLNERAVVLGRWLGALGYLALVTLLTLGLPALIFVHGKVSLGHVAAGYLGLLLVGALALSIGAAVASLARSALAAALGTAGTLGLLELGFYVARVTEPPWRMRLRDLAPVWGRFTSFRQGLLELLGREGGVS